MTTSSLTLTYSWTRTLRKPTAWRMERASSGVQTPWSPSSRRASPLSAGGPQPSVAQMCWATSTQASIAVTNVYFTPLSQIGSSRRSSPACDSPLSTETSSVMLRSRRRTRASSTTGSPGPGRDSCGELTVRTGDARQLVEVDLPGHRLPPDPGDRVILEQQPPADGHPPGQLE